MKATLLFISAPAALIAGALAVFMAIDDLWTALEGGELLLDWGPWLDDLRGIKQWLGEADGTLRDKFAYA